MCDSDIFDVLAAAAAAADSGADCTAADSCAAPIPVQKMWNSNSKLISFAGFVTHVVLVHAYSQPDGRAIAFAMAACNAARKWDQTISLYHYALKMGIERYFGHASMYRFCIYEKRWSRKGRGFSQTPCCSKILFILSFLARCCTVGGRGGRFSL